MEISVNLYLYLYPYLYLLLSLQKQFTVIDLKITTLFYFYGGKPVVPSVYGHIFGLQLTHTPSGICSVDFTVKVLRKALLRPVEVSEQCAYSGFYHGVPRVVCRPPYLRFMTV